LILDYSTNSCVSNPDFPGCKTVDLSQGQCYGCKTEDGWFANDYSEDKRSHCSLGNGPELTPSIVALELDTECKVGVCATCMPIDGITTCASCVNSFFFENQVFFGCSTSSSLPANCLIGEFVDI